MSLLANLAVLGLTYLGLETIGMDGMVIVLGYLTIILLLFGFLGEMQAPPRKPRSYGRGATDVQDR